MITFRSFGSLFQPATKRQVSVLNAISMTLLFLTLLMYTQPGFIQPSDAFDWKEPVIVIGGGIAAGCTIFTAVATAPTWVPIVGAVAGGIAAATAISEWLDDDCYDCDGSGCNTCEPPDDDDCDDCDGSGCSTCGQYLR